MKRSIPWLVRLIVSIAVLALLFRIAPLTELWAAVRAVPAWLAVFALFGFLVGHVISAFKWRCLIGLHDVVPMSLALRAHFAGLSANLCLPGIAGGDVVRAAWIMRQSERKTGIGIASLADRLLDCSALFAISCIGALISSKSDGTISTAMWTASAVIALPVVGGGIAYLLLHRWPNQGFMAKLANAIGVLVHNPWTLMQAFALSVFVQTLFVVLNFFLGTAAGVEAPLSAWLVAWPLAKLVALVPVSLNGLGVREAALVFFMRPFGAGAAAVTATSLYWQALLTAGSLIGACVVIVPGKWTANHLNSRISQPALAP